MMNSINQISKNIYKDYNETKEKLKNKLGENIKELNIDVELLKKAKLSL